MTRAGQLRDYVTIEVDNGSVDVMGQHIEKWEVLAGAENVPASVLGVSGTEAQRSNQMEAVGTDLVVMRYRRDITPKNRILFEGRTLNILSVSDRQGTKRELAIVCKES